MKRTVSIQASVDFEFEIDDEAVSDWDGAKILEVLEKRGAEVYVENATLEQILFELGIDLVVHNRTMGNFDGWADFKPEAASGSPYSLRWSLEGLQVSPR